MHRDIKPQNIIISTEGKVKVTDFGIARATNNNTINSEVMGSVHYASPEQARKFDALHFFLLHDPGLFLMPDRNQHHEVLVWADQRFLVSGLNGAV